MIKTVALGFAVPSGEPVHIPLKHLAITGQTQESGKTTTLEALITRSQMKAVTFITKRGEGSFTNSRRIAPYFRDAGDWQFVASILEASRGEKLKFERAWIIKASRGASRLEQVHMNVKKALKDAKGISESVYTTLDAYLDVVVPTIRDIHWAPALDIQDGVNAVDLTGMPLEMQHLVIRSCLSWVLHKEKETVVVIPEAWKFIPQGRGTPVKLAAEEFIRQGAALGNYLWLDSQDIGGVEKMILRSVPVWLLGVQREINEVKRTLDNIGIQKPTAQDIVGLELGQFFACWGKNAIKTYVQPYWIGDVLARRLAMGLAQMPAKREEDHVTKQEADELRSKNRSLEEHVQDLKAEIAELMQTVKKLEDQQAMPDNSHRVNKAVITRLLDGGIPAPMPPLPDVKSADGLDTERLYQAFKMRLLAEEAVLLKLATVQHELEVTVERKTVEVDGTTLKGRVAKLVKSGFFREGVTQSGTRKELARTGPDVNQGNLYKTLQELVTYGFLTDEGADGYREVAGMKVRIVEA